MICSECSKSEMIEKRENVRYDECGVPNIVLESVKVRQCPTCGHRLVSIPCMSELHRCIAVHLIKKVARLSPADIQFLRKYLGWSKNDFARKMHVKTEQVYRWESEKAPKPMMVQSELLLRAFVALGQKIENYDDHVEKIAMSETVEMSPFSMVFDDGWHEHQLVV